MSYRERFSDEDWAELVRSPMIASFAITAADPSGLIGTVQEASAAARALSDGRREKPASLIAEVVTAYETQEGRRLGQDAIRGILRDNDPAVAVGIAVERLSAIARLLDEYAGEEAGDFKRFLRDVAHSVAEAASEGGFLGIGGEKVSDKERRTLADIEAALGDGGTPFHTGHIPV